MPLPKPTTRFPRLSRPCLSSTTATTTTPAGARSLSATPARYSGHVEQDPPTGWLWGIPPGQKYKNEGWEHLAYWGIGGTFLLTSIAYAFKPDTR